MRGLPHRFVIFCGLCLGCTQTLPDDDIRDGGVPDVGAIVNDAGPDGGDPDAGEPDLGPSDAGSSDAETFDSGQGDASVDAAVDAGPIAPCGNGQPDPGETCDDGNTTPNDGCSAACLDETVFCAPRELGSLTQTDSVGRMVADAGFVYVVTDFQVVPGFPSLRIIDAQDPSAMRQTGTFNFSPANDFPNHDTIGIAKRGSFVWVGGENPEFWSVDVSNPAMPALGHQDGPNFSDGHIEIVGDRLYISYQVGETAHAYDISGGTNATLLTALIGDRGVPYYNITATETYAFVSSFTNGIDIVDVTGLPNDPPVVGRYTHATSWNDARALRRLAADDDTLAFVVEFGPAAGIHLVDVSLVTAPNFETTLSPPGPRDIVLQDNFLYVAVRDGLQVYDVQNPANPVPAGSFVLLNAFSASVALDGETAYLGTENSIRAIGGLPGLCNSTCGNSRVEYPEDCDDGNLLDGDQCTSQCQTPGR